MPGKILVIEDNAPNLELMSYLLRAFGHTVLAAADGEKGLQIVQMEKPDLVVCDVHLPGMNGYEVVRSMKQDPILQTIPVIAVTALAMVGDREKLLSAGFDGYIGKPIAAETFVPQLEEFLDKVTSRV